MAPRLTLGCAALFLGYCCVAAKSEVAQAEGAGVKAETVVRFEWLASAFSFEVVRIQDGRWLTANRRNQLGVGPTEGDYLAVVFVPQAAGAKEEILLLTRLRVDEVLVDSIRAEIAEEAAKHFTPGTTVALIRPRGSATKQIREVPASVPLIVKPNRNLPPNDVRFEAIGNLYSISLAWTNYRDVTNQRLPPAVVYGPDGKPWHSWRVLILPFMEHYELYKRYNMREPWNSEHNLKLLAERPSYYRDPARDDPDPTLTHFVAITGEGTAFPSRGARMSDDLKFEASKSPDTIPVDAIKDGLENTIIVGNAPVDAKIPWTKPEDIELTDDFPGLGKHGGFGAPYDVAGKRASIFLTAAEMRCVTVPATLPTNKLRSMFTIAGGEDAGIADLPALPPPQRPRPPRTTVIEIRGSGKSATAELFDEIVPTLEAPQFDK